MSRVRTGGKLNRVMLGMAAAVLLVIVGLSYREWREYRRANADAARTRETVDAVDQLLSDVIDAETGQRGYLLTGGDRYLEPYNQAIQAIPGEFANLRRLLAASPGDSARVSELTDLVNQKLLELRQTIELRRSQGAPPALDLVLSDRGRRLMDEIRRVCAAIKQQQLSVENQASLDHEAAAQTALLITVGGALILLFFFVVGLDPILAGNPHAKARSQWLTYSVAVVAAVVATLLRMALTPLIGNEAVPFITFFPSVLFVSWYGGLRAGALNIVLCSLATAYFFIAPVRSLQVRDLGGSITLLVFIVVGFGIALLGQSQRRAVERADREAAQRREAEDAERELRNRFETTLGSIGDAVISTDVEGRIVFSNPAARDLLRWPEAELSGKHLDQVFQIINEYTRSRVDSPVVKVLREGKVVGLANHTILIARDGTEVPIDDSAAPILDRNGALLGTVLVFRDIAERRRDEQARNLLAAIVEFSDDGIISKDLNGIITSWNTGAQRMFGYSAEQAVGQPISMLAAPGRDEMRSILDRILKGEKIQHYETVRRTNTGRLVHVSLTISPLRDGAGRIIGASKIVRDVTERVRASEELARSNQEVQRGRDLLKTTLASIGDAVISTDADGRIVFANRVAESLLGWPEAEMLGNSLDEVFRIVNEVSRQTVENPVAKVLREGKIVGLANHTVLIARDGTEIAIDDSAAPIRGESGAVLGAVLVFRDITQRRRAEKALRESEHRARELAEIVESSDDAIISGSFEGFITSWNRGAERIYGYSAEEALGQPVTFLEAPGRENEIRVLMSRVRNGERIEQYQTRRRRKDGTIIDVSLTVSAMRGDNGQLTGASVVARDITGQVRAASLLARMNADLEVANASLARSNEDLERFAFVASHDLQEPLRMITTYAQLLVQSYPGQFEKDGEMFVSNIIDGTKRMRELLGDLRAYTEFGAPLDDPPEPVDLNLVVDSVKHNLQMLIEETGAVIESAPLPTVSAHSSHMVPLFQNLIGNAIKYRSQDPPRIRIDVQDDGPLLRFSVADNGIGIDPEYHQKIFEVFKRLHGKKLPGTGVGLSICQRIVERYGGRIWVESRAGQGATFFFTLPGPGASSARMN